MIAEFWGRPRKTSGQGLHEDLRAKEMEKVFARNHTTWKGVIDKSARSNLMWKMAVNGDDNYIIIDTTKA